LPGRRKARVLTLFFFRVAGIPPPTYLDIPRNGYTELNPRNRNWANWAKPAASILSLTSIHKMVYIISNMLDTSKSPSKRETESPPPWLPPPDVELRALFAKVTREKRTQLAEGLCTRTRIRVTKHMLDDYASPSKKGARLPAFFILPICEITGSDELQRFVLSPRLREMLELGEIVARLLEQKGKRTTGRESRKRGARKRDRACAR